MALHSLNDIEKATGLSMPFIRKCLNKMTAIFDPHQQKGINNSIQLTDSGFKLFEYIKDFKNMGYSIPEIHQKLLNTDVLKGSNQVLKGTKTELNDNIKQLYDELDKERKRTVEEMEKRLQMEAALRSIQTEMRLLTGNSTIGEAKKIYDDQKLRRIELITMLENLNFWQSLRRKKILKELKELDRK